MGGIVSIFDLLFWSGKQLKSLLHSEDLKLDFPKKGSINRKMIRCKVCQVFINSNLAVQEWMKIVSLSVLCSSLLGHFAAETAKPASGSRRMENNM